MAQERDPGSKVNRAHRHGRGLLAIAAVGSVAVMAAACSSPRSSGSLSGNAGSPSSQGSKPVAIGNAGPQVVASGVAKLPKGAAAGRHSAAASKSPSAAPAPFTPDTSVPASAPSSAPAKVCGNPSVLDGPSSAPAGAITVPAGDNENFNFSRSATYWFAPGTHTMGSGEFAQIDPVAGSTFIGAPGAIYDGAHKNHYAFGGTATNVTIKNLTIQNFGVSADDNAQQGVVNHDQASSWTITRSTITANAGAGLMIGSHNVLSYDCVSDNAQYGFNAYSATGPVDITITHTEIAGNDSFDYETKQPGCGCSGGGKFWAVNGAVVTSNYVHDNKSVGLWADTNNRGFQFEGNYISNNQSSGIMYEISYNAIIKWNTFVANGIEGGPQNPGFPTSAIYISESGSDPRVPTAYSSQFLISSNVFTNNWGGVILWENANRFCGSPDNSSSSDCTLVNPAATTTSCANHTLIKQQPYVGDCRWKVQNVLVTGNTFNFSPSAVPGCSSNSGTCGYNGLFSEYGSDPSWSPFMADMVPNNIAYHQNNRFQGNTYNGPWKFMIWEQGTIPSWTKWRSSPYNEDSGSSLSS
jgi:hypothetical protein